MSNPEKETKPVVEQKPQEVVKPTATEDMSNIVESDTGINLVPILTSTEVVVEEKKRKLNMSAIVSLLFLFTISILVVGFNVFSKMQLNIAKENLFEKEDSLQQYSQKIVNNNEILDRIYLYTDIQKSQYSAKEVFSYINGVVLKNNGEIKSFVFSGANGIAFSGSAGDLEDVAKLWFLLDNDENFEEISMKSFSKQATGATFSFTGRFVVQNFLKSTSL